MYRIGANSALHADTGRTPTSWDEVIGRKYRAPNRHSVSFGEASPADLDDEEPPEVLAQKKRQANFTFPNGISVPSAAAPKATRSSSATGATSIHASNGYVSVLKKPEIPSGGTALPVVVNAKLNTSDPNEKARNLPREGERDHWGKGSHGERLMKEYRKGVMPSTLWHPVYVTDTRDPRDIVRWCRPLARPGEKTADQARDTTRRTAEQELNRMSTTGARLFREEYVRRKNNSGYEMRVVYDQGLTQKLEDIKQSFADKLEFEKKKKAKAIKKERRDQKKLVKSLKALGLNVTDVTAT